jgi:hypothetical protein
MSSSGAVRHTSGADAVAAHDRVELEVRINSIERKYNN